MSVEDDSMHKREGPKFLTDNERDLIKLIVSLGTKEDLVILVEGRRDEEVLRDLGVRSDIVRTQTFVARADIVDHLAEFRKQVLILTDFDDEGIELDRYFERELTARKVRVLSAERSRIRLLFGDWKCIEEMHGLFKRLDSPEPVKM
ncbi:MAG: hypothetical protein ACTSV3_06280 [Candidatus Thorarchaeota archaeon]